MVKMGIHTSSMVPDYRANTGLHGGLSVNHKPHVWDDTLENTIDNGSLLQLAIQYLRSQGFSVRT